jgi:hypothetical protein
MTMATPPKKPDSRPVVAGKRVSGWKQVTDAKPVFPKAGSVPPAKPGAPTEGVTIKPRTAPDAPWNKPVTIAGKSVPGYRQVKPQTDVEASGPTVRVRSSGLSGQGGVLGGQHAGGHSDVAGSRPGGFDEPLGGGATNSFNK